MARLPLPLVAVSALLAMGNSKLGPGIWVWSLPAALTCPGKTALCVRLCYALKYRFTTARYLWQVMQNWVLASTPLFTRWMIYRVQASKCKAVRIHASGDFFSAAYVRRWIAVARALPGVRFYAYTRSHAKHGMRRELYRLSELPNVRLFYSIDREMAVPSVVPPRVRLAYLMADREDLPPPEADLVFLDYKLRKTGRKYFNGVLGCPAETVGITCTQCRLCIDPLGEKDPRSYKRRGLPVLTS